MPLNDFRSIHLPYVIKKMEDGLYRVLNREYMPLGFRTKDLRGLDLAPLPISVRFKGLTRSLAMRVSHKGSDNLDAIYLYDDGCVPTKDKRSMQQYLARLELLAKLRVDKPESF